MTCTWSSTRAQPLAQFVESAGDQAAEGQHTAWPQDAARLGEHGGQVRAPLQSQTGEDEIAAGVAQRQAFGIGGQVVAGTGALGTGMAEHAGRQVQGQALGLRMALGQGAAAIAGATAQIQPALRMQNG